MKLTLFVFLTFLGVQITIAQDLNDLFSAGIEDAERFSNDYLAPASVGAMHSISNGWYNSGQAKPPGGFEISIIGNMSTFQDEDKTFVLNTEDYENLQFVDGSTSKPVSTALGELEGIDVFVEGEVLGITQRTEFELPSGLAAEDINFIPSAFVQASVGLFKGTEIKARFLPKVNFEDDGEAGLFGLGIQHDFTQYLPANKLFPVAISGVIGYTNLNASYDFTDTEIIAGENQRIDVNLSTWVFQAVVSTKLPVINFYGGLGYLTGSSTIDVLGTYVVESGPFINETYTDPFSIESSANGVRANIGAKLKLGFFRLNADYTFADFNNLSIGVNFGFR